VSLRESDAIKDATLRDGLLTSVILSSLSADPKQSEEGEVVRAMEHIADKAEKFPIPSPGAFHVILVDMRGYGIGMADHHDFREIAYDAAAVREECRHYWNGHPVAGVFDTRNARRSARLVQTRVHFLGFLKEKHCITAKAKSKGSDTICRIRAFYRQMKRQPQRFFLSHWGTALESHFGRC
jgi:hypothetical protein